MHCCEESREKEEEQKEVDKEEEMVEEDRGRSGSLLLEGINMNGCRCVLLSLHLQPSTKPAVFGTVLFVSSCFIRLFMSMLWLLVNLMYYRYIVLNLTMLSLCLLFLKNNSETAHVSHAF